MDFFLNSKGVRRLDRLKFKSDQNNCEKVDPEIQSGSILQTMLCSFLGEVTA